MSTSKGKITSEQYTNLKKEISALYEEVYEKELDPLKKSSDRYDRLAIQLEEINRNVTDGYLKDRINNEHYTNLKNEISIAYKKIYTERILSEAVELDRIREEITEAYSDNKITKLHYELLNEKISKMSKEDGNGSLPH